MTKSQKKRRDYMASRERLLASAPHCYLCGKRLTMADLTLDHIIPKARGGVGMKQNKLPCCIKCNKLKADMMPLYIDPVRLYAAVVR